MEQIKILIDEKDLTELFKKNKNLKFEKNYIYFQKEAEKFVYSTKSTKKTIKNQNI